jgi:hypothetical protein
MASKTYNDIISGIGRPKEIDQLYDLAREHKIAHGWGNNFSQELMNAADRLSRLWREESIKEYIEGLEILNDCFKYERDEARRWCCEQWASSSCNNKKMSAQDYASETGWDCYEEKNEADENNKDFRSTDGE